VDAAAPLPEYRRIKCKDGFATASNAANRASRVPAVMTNHVAWKRTARAMRQIPGNPQSGAIEHPVLIILLPH
jgi:hypothetical protein